MCVLGIYSSRECEVCDSVLARLIGVGEYVCGGECARTSKLLRRSQMVGRSTKQLENTGGETTPPLCALQGTDYSQVLEPNIELPLEKRYPESKR
jgi:hypothetical protein